MKPWMGAAAVAAALLFVPSSAMAGNDDPALLNFSVPTEAQYDDFEALGLDMGDGVEKRADGSVIVQAWVTDDQLAWVRAHGFENVGVVHDKYNIDRIRAEREQSIADERAAKQALNANKAGKAGPSAAPGTVRAQRADYYESTAGRYISIEANATDAQVTCTNPTAGTGCSYTGPQLVASWYDAAGNQLGSGNLSAFLDTDVNPDYYQYHITRYRVGAKGDGPPVASIKVAAPNGDVDTLKAKTWADTTPPGLPATFLSNFNTRYYMAQEGYDRVKSLATEFPTIAKSVKAPEQTWGYMNKAATVIGYQNASYVTFNTATDASTGTTYQAPTGSTTALTGAPASRAVLLRSKAWGHEGGNGITAQLVDPGAPSSAIAVTVVDKAITVRLGTNAAGAIVSTAQDVITAINGTPAASALVTATNYRTATPNGVVVPSVVSPLSDMLRAPAYIKRGPQDQFILRIGNDKGKPQGQKAGVFLYCQEHGGEIATSGVCLETMERLVRNYGTDAATTAMVDNLDIFIQPFINADGSTYSIYDSPRRTNMSRWCEDTVMYPQNTVDPMYRNSYGVNINRNFSVGSVFDGFQGATNVGCAGSNYSGPAEFSEPETRNEVWVQTNFPNIKFANNIHSSGNLFMWPPGAYTPQRVALPYPPYGTLNFFDQTASHVINGIKGYRDTTILPQQTGPVIDVLYSAAGNSADEAYYNQGIIGYDFEIGTSQQPNFASEGVHQGMEFAAGNYGLLQSAFDYEKDTAAPVVGTDSTSDGKGTYTVKFTSNEASSIYYTTDGSTPTTASTEWVPTRPRALPLPLDLAPGTKLSWIAKDYKGNVSAAKSQVLGRTDTPGTVGGSVPATLSLTLGAPAQFPAFTPGITKPYLATTAATVISTAGDATLSVADPSSNNTGHLVNGTFALPQPLQARGRNAANPALPYANVGSSASPLSLLTYSGPVSNDAVSLDFSQQINANDALRTVTYSKALTFTLSTTTP
jgi:hypothetical protein